MKNSDDNLIIATRQLAAIARDEDLGNGDLTSQLLAGAPPATYKIVARAPGNLAGRAIADEILAAYGDDIMIKWANEAADGSEIGSEVKTLASLTGPPSSILAVERVLLNFLQRLCGIATLTRQYVDEVAGTKAKIFDTRKTIPGWRQLDKYAVRCGGGFNHRVGLFDAVMIKDNHIANVPVDRLAAHVFSLLNHLASADRQPEFIEVEADTLEQVEALLSVVGINIILLDNFTTDQLRSAVKLRNELNLTDRVQFEASGGITIESVRTVAETGVDRISIGAITHSAPALDLALEV